MEKESERKAQNTQYVPTKCRVTKPVPPKPATNPLQFVAVKPSPLLIKAQEINKKVEIVKEARKERKEEAEDWQSNLDNWKSSRRKRQEHIIERVEEVKKLELQEKERSGNRRGTTFSEILEKRNKGRFSIPIYDNDSNDLSDYGIGSSSSKTNSIKDVDTDDNSSILDEKENSYDEATSPTNTVPMPHKEEEEKPQPLSQPLHPQLQPIPKSPIEESPEKKNVSPNKEQYTYEGAIEDYRSRIRSKINLNDSVLEVKVESYKSKEFSEAQSLLPKGNLTERRRMFEAHLNGNSGPKEIGEDLMNAQSIKERLQSLEKCVEQPVPVAPTKSVSSEDVLVGNLKSRLTQFTAMNSVAACDSDAKNINADTKMSKSEYSREYHPLDEYLDHSEMNGFRPSTSSSDLVAASSDREDSGIHTADVSCSVSQSDEPVEDGDIQHEAPNYKTITETFLHGEKEFADKTHVVFVVPKTQHQEQKMDILENFLETEAFIKEEVLMDEEIVTIPPKETFPEHSPLVENIAKTIQDVSMNSELDDDKIIDLYDNSRVPFTMESIDIFANPLAPPKLQPPTEKPPPPPPLNDDNDNRISSPSLRIKKELLMKRSSFLGLEEAAINEQLEQLENQEKQKELDEQLHEQELKRQLHLQDQEVLSTLANGEQEMVEQRPTDEEIMKKEREIIEMIEKEEKCNKHYDVLESKDFRNNANSIAKPSTDTVMEPNDIYLGNKKFDEPFYPEPCYDSLNDQDSEVLRVEQELLQLEQEELKRQRDIQLFKERSAKLSQANNANTYENMYYDCYAKQADTRKSMPDLKNLPNVGMDLRQSHVFHVAPPTYHQKSTANTYPIQPLPPLQHVPHCHRMRSTPKYDIGIPVNHRKSMPDLERTVQSAFTPTANNNLLMPIKPLKPLEKKDRYMSQNPMESDGYKHAGRGMPRHSMPHQPRSKSTPREAWIQPKAKPQTKSYNQHWLYQEAELRRLADQQKAAALQNRQSHIHHVIDKNVIDPKRIMSDSKLSKRSVDPLSQKDYVNIPYMGRQPLQTYGHALPMSYPQSLAAEDGRDVILSVSGKKKCSYCSNELGRGAAMIIESLSLFYHMECFKCCVCHIELGDGLMGTDVRVRNQKLHCHNCYSSDDGIKFSCV